MSPGRNRGGVEQANIAVEEPFGLWRAVPRTCPTPKI